MSRYIAYAHIRWIIFAASLLLAVSSGALAQDPCEDGSPILAGTTSRDVQWTSDPQCYTVDLPLPGILLLEVTAGSESSAIEPELEVFDCTTSGRVLDRWAASWLVESPTPGRYAVCVAAQDPARHLGSFKLITAFSAQLLAKGGDPDEDELEPDSTLPPPPPPPSSGLVFDPVPAPSSLVAGRDDLCSAVRDDDHGDLLRCATSLVPGETVAAEIRNAWGDDDDLFVLRLDDHASVRLTLGGDAGIRAALYDRRGNRLRVPEIGAAGEPELVKALVPGLYFVRVHAAAGLEGVYSLEASVATR